MKRALWGSAIALCGAAALGQAAPRSTIRVGLWTLWRDKQAAVTPIAGATLRLCESCRALPLESIDGSGKRCGADLDGCERAGTFLRGVAAHRQL